MKELIETYEEYIRLLHDELNETVPYAIWTGWKSSRAEKGQECRNKIIDLRTAVNLAPGACAGEES